MNSNPSSLLPTEKQIQEAVLWIRENHERFWAILGTFVLAILVLVFWLHNRELQNDEAWNQLGNIQGHLSQGKLDDVHKSLVDWNARFQGSNAVSYAKFVQAQLAYGTSDYVTAAQIYGDIAQSGDPKDLRPLALSAQSSAEEMAGHYDKALSLAQAFTTQYPDHFFAASAYLAQARLLELTHNAPAASALYDRFVILYPQSPWVDFAKTRLQSLSGSSPAVPK